MSPLSLRVLGWRGNGYATRRIHNFKRLCKGIIFGGEDFKKIFLCFDAEKSGVAPSLEVVSPARLRHGVGTVLS